MDGAYRRIFARCGLRAVAVEADSGAIGGSASQEFMVTADAGEDLILASPDGRYAANQERAVSLPPDPVPLPRISAPGEPSQLPTPGQSSIEALSQAHGLDPTQIVKVLLLVARLADGSVQPLLVSLRGDQQLNEVKLTNAVAARAPAQAGGVLEIAPLDAERCRAWQLNLDLAAIPFGYLGPDLDDAVLSGTPRSFLRLVDPTAAELERFVCGANTVDRHRLGVTWSDLGGVPESVDLRAAQAGDRCLHDPSQRLEAARGIEVGHIFQLGRRYSEALDARFTNESGEEEALWMGCYGIGVSRLAQAAVEQHHDADGICWPVSIAPFEVVVVIASAQDPEQVKRAEDLYAQLRSAGVETLLDDRAERAGVKFKDADLIGIPWRLVVGRGAAEGRVELVERRRGGERLELPSEEALTRLLARLPEQRRGVPHA
jgi:prolyl-tRNA synthetase